MTKFSVRVTFELIKQNEYSSTVLGSDIITFDLTTQNSEDAIYSFEDVVGPAVYAIEESIAEMNEAFNVSSEI